MIRAVVAAALSVVCAASCTHNDRASGNKPAQQRNTGTPAASPVAARAVALAPRRPIVEWQLSGAPFGLHYGLAGELGRRSATGQEHRRRSFRHAPACADLPGATGAAS